MIACTHPRTNATAGHGPRASRNPLPMGAVAASRSSIAAASRARAPGRARVTGAATATSGNAASPAAPRPSALRGASNGAHHFPLVCADLEASLAFYSGLLGLERNKDRPDDKLPYRGAWLRIGGELIQIMEFPTRDPSDPAAPATQPAARDRHELCISVPSLPPVLAKLDAAGVAYEATAAAGAAAAAAELRDPDGNVVKLVQASALRAR